MVLLIFVFTLFVFPFLSRSYSVNLEVHSVHSHAVAEARLYGYVLKSVVFVCWGFQQTMCMMDTLAVHIVIEGSPELLLEYC